MALDFAHFGNGDSFSSDVVLVNLAATPIQPLVFFYDTSDFTGSVRCTALEGPGGFTGVGVEMDVTNGIFTTLPVVPVDR